MRAYELYEARIFVDQRHNTIYRVWLLSTLDNISKSVGQLALTDVEQARGFNSSQFEKENNIYFHEERSFIVDPGKKQVNLDYSQTSTAFNRRKHGERKSAPIPQSEIGFDGDIRNLRKTFYELINSGIQKDLAEFAIIGSDYLAGKSVADLLQLPDPYDQMAQLTHSKLIAYHGTSGVRWNVIKKQGLRPGQTKEVYSDLVPGYSGKNVYVSFSPAEARNYATRAALFDRSSAIVLRVEINDLTKLLPDEDTMWWLFHDIDPAYHDEIKRRIGYKDTGDYFSDGYHKENILKKPHEHSATFWQAWKTTLIKGARKAKTVAYRGNISPNKIALAQSFKPVLTKRDPNKQEYQAAMDKTMGSLKSA